MYPWHPLSVDSSQVGLRLSAEVQVTFPLLRDQISVVIGALLMSQLIRHHSLILQFLGPVFSLLLSEEGLGLLRGSFPGLGDLLHLRSRSCRSWSNWTVLASGQPSRLWAARSACCLTLSILHQSRRWPWSTICKKKLASLTRPMKSRASSLLVGFLRDILRLNSYLNCQTILPLDLFPCLDVGHRLGRYTVAWVDLTYRFNASFELPSCFASFLRVWPLSAAFQISSFDHSALSQVSLSHA